MHGHCHGNLRDKFCNGKMLDVGLDMAYLLEKKHCLLEFEDIKLMMDFTNIYSADHHKIIENNTDVDSDN